MEQPGLPDNFPGSQESIYKPTSDERTLAILAHALTLVAQFLAPLIIYLVKKDDSKFVADQAKESLNFQITVFLTCIVLIITVIGIFIIWLVVIAATIFVILASIKASEGKLYRYPLCIRFIK
jgi:uncharacterized Tic20 family protein